MKRTGVLGLGLRVGVKRLGLMFGFQAGGQTGLGFKRTGFRVGFKGWVEGLVWSWVEGWFAGLGF